MTDRFTHVHEPIRGLHVLDRRRLGDDRGFLERLYDSDAAGQLLPFARIAQINRTMTALEGTVRGMHFQRQPYAEVKLVHCIRGSVFDVAVDLREGSPTYLHWHAEVLSADNGRCLRIPEGFAHGFQALEAGCELIYVHSQPYRQDAECGVWPLDPQLGIAWPRAIALMSDRDAQHGPIDATFQGVIA
ncbi:dTDP-4-dehydrorhamnose 3,5-epimerase family protein [Luteibacter sp. ME-Dv--P-043b]|uniref:dTDP-4-dehydrorhamnose 3,5-epimerase family protein n=1 Tax=Luteibacter sp. ME-Dv--P-043b TaxID=3040291 RepID=UPI0025548741|nr:dTDP-4-dehydrorhamnose 3,5-epimerase family protein [Luteibacter sp. ME-Dv--P-043b]